MMQSIGIPGQALVSASVAARAMASVACAAVLLTGPVAAQQPSQALEPPCRADAHAPQAVAAAEAFAWPRQSAPVALTPACWLGPDELRERSQSPQRQAATLIDVRSMRQRSLAPLMGQVMQMERADVASKRFLKREPVILLGSGLDHADLDATCRQLREQGFADVKALMGGGPALLRVQADSQGMAQSVAQQLTASDWIASMGQGVQWSVLSLSRQLDASPATQRPVADAQMGRAEVAGGSPHAPDLARQMLAIAGRHRGHDASPWQAQQAGPAHLVPRALMVIADAPAEPLLHAQLAQELAGLTQWPEDMPVYWLLGGWQAYQAQVASMQAIQRTAGHPLRAPCRRL